MVPQSGQSWSVIDDQLFADSRGVGADEPELPRQGEPFMVNKSPASGHGLTQYLTCLIAMDIQL